MFRLTFVSRSPLGLGWLAPGASTGAYVITLGGSAIYYKAKWLPTVATSSTEAEFMAAKDRGEVDKALDLMARLDKMLTPAEAEPFREAAREVFAKKRDNMGLQFKLAIQDKEWKTAVSVGEEIMGKFPNSRMAEEVREMIGQLRGNAEGKTQAPPSA